MKFSFTDKTKAEIAAAKGSLTHSPSPTGEGSGNSGGGNTGGGNNGDDGDDNNGLNEG